MDGTFELVDDDELLFVLDEALVFCDELECLWLLLLLVLMLLELEDKCCWSWPPVFILRADDGVLSVPPPVIQGDRD